MIGWFIKTVIASIIFGAILVLIFLFTDLGG
jgi:hypothetical protein